MFEEGYRLKATGDRTGDTAGSICVSGLTGRRFLTRRCESREGGSSWSGNVPRAMRRWAEMSSISAARRFCRDW